MTDHAIDGEQHGRPGHKSSSVTTCTNCGAAMVNVFCADCGERQPGHHDLSMKHVAHDVVHELVHVDSKVFSTLRSVVMRPGFLPMEYFAGRKSRYIPPLRLFLIFFALQFIAYTYYKPAVVYSVTAFKRFDTRGSLTKLLERKAAKHHMTGEEYEAKVDERWHKNISLLQLANIFGVAVTLKVLYRRRYLAEHLVFSAYFLAFSYIVSLLFWPVYARFGFHPGPLQTIMSVVSVSVVLVYLFLAQRRFYGDATGKTIVKTTLLWAGIYFVSVMILASSLLAALLQER